MASTFIAMSCTGSMAAPSSRVMDKRLAVSSEKLSSLSSISSCTIGRRQSITLRKSRDPKICAMAKDLYFNRDGSAVKKLQVSLCTYICAIIEATPWFGF